MSTENKDSKSQKQITEQIFRLEKSIETLSKSLEIIDNARYEINNNTEEFDKFEKRKERALLKLEKVKIELNMLSGEETESWENIESYLLVEARHHLKNNAENFIAQVFTKFIKLSLNKQENETRTDIVHAKDRMLKGYTTGDDVPYDRIINTMNALRFDNFTLEKKIAFIKAIAFVYEDFVLDLLSFSQQELNQETQKRTID